MKLPYRTAVCVVRLEPQDGHPYITVRLNPDIVETSAEFKPLVFADVELALVAVRAFAEKWRDDARRTAVDGLP